MPNHNLLIKSEWEEIPLIDDEQTKNIKNPETIDSIIIMPIILFLTIILFFSLKLLKNQRFYNKY